MLGAFLAQDLALFVIFFDLMLIPFYFIGVTWGVGPNRQRAVLKMVIYTFVGSLLMLSAVIATGVLATPEGQSISFALSDLRERTLGTGTQEWIFLFMAFAFLVKMPAFPFHGWMPDGYKVLPVEALAVFSAVLSKVAAYGFLRIALPIYPDAAAHFQDLLLILALCSILYGSVMAFTNDNARLVAGYSSVAQLGFITLGHLRAERPRRPGRDAADGQPRPRGDPADLHRRPAGPPRRRLGEPARHGRHRLPRACAGHRLPDRRARHPGHARHRRTSSASS